MIDILDDKKAFEELNLVVFELLAQKENHSFGINAHKVREVVEMQKIDSLPELYRPYIGVLNLRGIPIPILDVSFIFSKDIKNIDLTKDYRIVICEIMGIIIGILAKTKIKMLTIPDTQVMPLGFNLNTVNSEYLSGLIDTGESYIFMLNLESILDELGVFAMSSSVKLEKKYIGKTAVIVEDSRLFQKKLSKLLEAIGFSVLLAEDGEAGIALIDKTPHLDIIFSDIEMPKLNGIEMVREIKKDARFNNKPIIFNSSISNLELVKMIEEESLGSYITKFDEEIILEKLNSIF